MKPKDEDQPQRAQRDQAASNLNGQAHDQSATPPTAENAGAAYAHFFCRATARSRLISVPRKAEIIKRAVLTGDGHRQGWHLPAHAHQRRPQRGKQSHCRHTRQWEYGVSCNHLAPMVAREVR